MAERIQQDKSNAVSMSEYLASLAWRVSAEELAEPPEDQARPRFILRLLDPDLQGAYDRLMEVSASDKLGKANEGKSGALITVRPVLEGAQTGKAESYAVDPGGLVVEDDVERGYFVDSMGIDEGEISGAYALVLRKPLEAPALKSMELPLPE